MATAMGDMTKDRVDQLDFGIFPDTFIMPMGRNYWKLWRKNSVKTVARFHWQWIKQRFQDFYQ
jgi:hypothetical protein